MTFDRATVSQQASVTGFRPETLEKVLRLGELLADFSRHPLLSRVLALKGGTALNLFFGAPRRLSVDLDFNYIGSAGREQMIAQRPEVERAINQIAGGSGYRIQQAADAHAGRKFYLNYRNIHDSPDRIEVDVNYLLRVPLGETAARAMWRPEGYDAVTFPLVSTEELFAGKLLAMLDRVAPRDLYDAAFLPDIDSAVWASIRFRGIFIALSGILVQPLTAYTESRFDRIDDRIVNEQLRPTIRTGEDIAADSLRRSARDTVRPLLELEENEREYTDRLQRGELRPDLLFPDDALFTERLARHPALLWKLENVRRHRRSRKQP